MVIIRGMMKNTVTKATVGQDEKQPGQFAALFQLRFKIGDHISNGRFFDKFAAAKKL